MTEEIKENTPVVLPEPEAVNQDNVEEVLNNLIESSEDPIVRAFGNLLKTYL